MHTCPWSSFITRTGHSADTRYPVSSNVSLTAQSAAFSPSSSLPPGSPHALWLFLLLTSNTWFFWLKQISTEQNIGSSISIESKVIFLSYVTIVKYKIKNSHSHILERLCVGVHEVIVHETHVRILFLKHLFEPIGM